MVSFKEIEYTKIGTYKYTIEETTVMTGGMSNSGTIDVTVEVTDNYDGTLTATPTYKDDNQTIVNTYEAKGKVQLEATKVLEGRDWLEGESYDFVLSGKDGEIDRQAVDANETVTFKKINYTEVDAGKTYIRLQHGRRQGCAR